LGPWVIIGRAGPLLEGGPTCDKSSVSQGGRSRGLHLSPPICFSMSSRATRMSQDGVDCLAVATAIAPQQGAGEALMAAHKHQRQAIRPTGSLATQAASVCRKTKPDAAGYAGPKPPGHAEQRTPCSIPADTDTPHPLPCMERCLDLQDPNVTVKLSNLAALGTSSACRCKPSCCAACQKHQHTALSPAVNQFCSIQPIDGACLDALSVELHHSTWSQHPEPSQTQSTSGN
jgi:hypothetical protein